LRDALGGVVLVVADEAGGDLKVFKKLAGVAGVFCRHPVHFP